MVPTKLVASLLMEEPPALAPGARWGMAVWARGGGCASPVRGFPAGRRKPRDGTNESVFEVSVPPRNSTLNLKTPRGRCLPGWPTRPILVAAGLCSMSRPCTWTSRRRPVAPMYTKPLREALGDAPHEIRRVAVEAIDGERKIQWFLPRPQRVVVVRGKELGRRSAGDPADGHGFSGRQLGLEMHDAIHPHFGPAAEPAAVEDRRPGRDEDLLLDRGPDHVRVRADEHVVAEPAVVAGRRAHDRVLHDDAGRADRDGAALGHEPGTVHDASAGAKRDVAAHRRVRCDPRLRVDARRLAGVLDDHSRTPCSILGPAPVLRTGRQLGLGE